MASKDERSVYITNFSAEVTEDLLKELFIQVGPVETVFVKKNDTGGRDFALVSFVHPESVLFAVETLDEIRLFNTPLNVKPKMGTEQEKAYRRKQEEQRNSRLNSTPAGHGDYGSYLLNSLSSGMILPPPPIPPNIFVTPNGNVHHSPLTSIPYGPGGVHPSVMAGYNTPPGFNGPPADWRGSMPSLIDPSSSSRNSYDRDNRRDNSYDRRSEGGRSYERRESDRWNNGGSGGRGGGGSGGRGGSTDYRDYRNNGQSYRNDSTPNRYGNYYGNTSNRRQY